MTPEKVSIPAPDFVIEVPAPLMIPEIVKLPMFVMVEVAGKTNGHEIVAVPVIPDIAVPFAMVSELAPLITELLFIKVMRKQLPVALMVTVTPLLMVTSSDAVGTALPPQVAVLFQFPDTDAVFEIPLTS